MENSWSNQFIVKFKNLSFQWRHTYMLCCAGVCGSCVCLWKVNVL